MNPLLYFNNDPVKVLNIFRSDITKYFLVVTIIKYMNKIKNIVFTLPSLAAAIIFGVFCALFQSHRDVKCFLKSFNSPKTALEKKSASKNRAEKDYEVVDLKY